MGDRRHDPAALPPERDSVQEAGWVPRPVWTDTEYFATTRLRSRAVQPVASRYTDWAIPAHKCYHRCALKCFVSQKTLF